MLGVPEPIAFIQIGTFSGNPELLHFPIMVHGCGNRVVKFLFFTANLLICLFGALIFGFSLWANLDKNFIVKLGEVRGIHKEDFNVLENVSIFKFFNFRFIPM